MIFDLSAKDYTFNKNLVSNSAVNKAIIYGKNGIGKSFLGIVLFDIVILLQNKKTNKYLKNMESGRNHIIKRRKIMNIVN